MIILFINNCECLLIGLLLQKTKKLFDPTYHVDVETITPWLRYHQYRLNCCERSIIILYEQGIIGCALSAAKI